MIKPTKFKIWDIIKRVLKDGIGYKVLVWDDEQDQSFTNYQMRGNDASITAGDIGDGGNVDFSADAYVSKTDDLDIYGILIKCNVKGGLYFKSNNTLSIKVDDRKMEFNLDDDFYSINEFSNFGDIYYIEICRFLVNKEILKLIADSINVEFKVHGKEQTIEGYLTKKNIRRFKEFYYEYL